MKGLKFFVCRDSIRLGRKVARLLGTNLSKLHLADFADGEIRVWVEEKVKGKKCVVLQTTRIDPNNRLMELCLVISALKKAGAKSVLAVIPCFGYSRQSDIYQVGETNSAALAARFLETSGVDKLVFVNLHTEKILEFFKIKTVNLLTGDLLAEEIKKLPIRDFVLVAPDEGSAEYVAGVTEKLDTACVIVKKKRKIKGFGSEDKSKALSVSGKVRGKDVVIVDDEISSGETVVNAAKLLKRKGAKKIYVLVTHPVFSKKTYENLPQAPFEEIVVTDTIPLDKLAFKKLPNLRVISVAKMISGEIKKLV